MPRKELSERVVAARLRLIPFLTNALNKIRYLAVLTE
jgi:hypothetical protein